MPTSSAKSPANPTTPKSRVRSADIPLMKKPQESNNNMNKNLSTGWPLFGGDSFRKHLAGIGSEWMYILRDNREAARRAGLRSTYGRRERGITSWIRKSTTEIIKYILVFGIFAWFFLYIGLQSLGTLCTLAAITLIAMICIVRKTSNDEILDLVDGILSATAKASQIAGGSLNLDQSVLTIKMQVVATKILQDAVLVTEAGCLWHPPTVDTILQEVAMLDVAGGGMSRAGLISSHPCTISASPRRSPLRSYTPTHYETNRILSNSPLNSPLIISPITSPVHAPLHAPLPARFTSSYSPGTSTSSYSPRTTSVYRR